METEKEFLSATYNELLDVAATLDIMELSRYSMDDTKITREIESLYTVIRGLKRSLNGLADRIDNRMHGKEEKPWQKREKTTGAGI